MPDAALITRREWRSYFGSPVAYLFMAAFLIVTLFMFFWVDTFFARNVASVHALFHSMPLLLVFLVAAITMRSWSEERRSGTLELLLTAPRSATGLVLGKFFGCLGLVAVTIALTLPIPITVSLMGPLDWGPVAGGYIASLLLASVYISLGLLISMLTESQVVSLIGTLLVGLALYFIGTPELTDLVGPGVATVLQGLSTSAHFASIARGVVTVGDVAYYVSVAILFLALNVLWLERARWSAHGDRKGHRARYAAAALLFVNVVLLNVWLAPIHSVRADLTQGHIYSLSPTTIDYLHQLRQPLLIRGYFGKKTHPLLAPLVPQLENLLRQYAARGGGHVKVEIVDPQGHPKQVANAASRYGITPVPFRIESKYEASVVNSYFAVLLKYGNHHKVLKLQNLIRVDDEGSNHLSVVLNDPEYHITRAVEKLVSEYRRGGDIFTSIKQPVTLDAFISSNADLPAEVLKLRQGFTKVVAKLKREAGDKLRVDIQDPGTPDGARARALAARYGIRPLSTSLLGTHPFYFDLVLQQGSRQVPVPLPNDLDRQDLAKNINAALARFASGILNTVAIYTPPQPPGYPGMPSSADVDGYRLLEQALRDKAVLVHTNLESGSLPAGANVLLVLGPEHLSHKQLFTIDQALMRGDTVVIAASPYHVGVSTQGISIDPEPTGLSGWLAAKGIHIGKTLVLDPQNAKFPLPVTSNLDGIPVREFRDASYPYFVDVRQNGMPSRSVITDGLGQLTMTWASPVTLGKVLPDHLHATPLLQSSPQSWLSSSTAIEPVASGTPPPWQAPVGHRGSHLLAVAVRGEFRSWFAHHSDPFAVASADAGESGTAAGKGDPAPATTSGHAKPAFKVHSVLDHSPPGTRLVVIASPTFLDDAMIGLQGIVAGQPYEQPIQLMRNTLDWALGNPALLALRGQRRVSRILEPLSNGERAFWEYLNYALALIGVLVVFAIARGVRRWRDTRFVATLGAGAEGGAA